MSSASGSLSPDSFRMFLLGVFVLAVLSGGTAAVAGFGIGSLLTPLLAAQFRDRHRGCRRRDSARGGNGASLLATASQHRLDALFEDLVC